MPASAWERIVASVATASPALERFVFNPNGPIMNPTHPLRHPSLLAACAALCIAIPAASCAASVALSATGWNSDIIFDNSSGTYNQSINGTLDNGPGNINGYSYYQSGSYPLQPSASDIKDLSSTGVHAGTYISSTGSGNSFAFQSVTANNALLLNNTNSGTLTLASSISLSSLALYGTTGGGASAASVVLNFSDGSTSLYTIAGSSGITRDWFKPTDGSGDSQVALAVGGRVSNRGEEGYTTLYQQMNDRISIYESILAITPADQLKLINSVTITNTGGAHLAVMALSGTAVPEPSSLALVAICGAAGLVRRRRA